MFQCGVSTFFGIVLQVLGQEPSEITTFVFCWDDGSLPLAKVRLFIACGYEQCFWWFQGLVSSLNFSKRCLSFKMTRLWQPGRASVPKSISDGNWDFQMRKTVKAPCQCCRVRVSFSQQMWRCYLLWMMSYKPRFFPEQWQSAKTHVRQF